MSDFTEFSDDALVAMLASEFISSARANALRQEIARRSSSSVAGSAAVAPDSPATPGNSAIGQSEVETIARRIAGGPVSVADQNEPRQALTAFWLAVLFTLTPVALWWIPGSAHSSSTLTAYAIAGWSYTHTLEPWHRGQFHSSEHSGERTLSLIVAWMGLLALPFLLWLSYRTGGFTNSLQNLAAVTLGGGLLGFLMFMLYGLLLRLFALSPAATSFGTATYRRALLLPKLVALLGAAAALVSVHT